MAICLECEKEYTPSPEGFMSATGVHPELCPECAAAAAMAACKECGREFTPPKQRPLIARSVQYEICPECVEAANATFAKLMVEATPRVFITPAIIIINLIIFAAMLVSGVSPINPKIEQLIMWGADFGPDTLDGQWWRLLSCAFVHIGAMHLALNMWCLWNLGRLAERMFGNRTFLALYLFSGLGGSIASVWWNPNIVSAGASGAVFGVAGGVMAFWQLGKSSIPRAVVKQNLGSVLTFAVYNLSYGFFHSGIDNAAHIGGLVTGLALGASLRHPLTRTEGASRLRAALAYSGVSLALLLGIGAAYKSNRTLIKVGKAARSLEAGDFDQAIASFKEALEIKPDIAEALHDLGVAYLRKGSNDEALAAFKQTIEVSHKPGLSATAYSNMGLIYVRKSLFDEAIDYLEKSIQLQPNDAETYYLLGGCYVKKNLYQKAIAAYRRALELEPDFAEAHAGLGHAYEGAGRYEQAIVAYQNALKSKPDDETVREDLKRVSLKQGAGNNEGFK